MFILETKLQQCQGYKQCASGMAVTLNILFLTLKELSGKNPASDFCQHQLLMELIKQTRGKVAATEICAEAFTSEHFKNPELQPQFGYFLLC